MERLRQPALLIAASCLFGAAILGAGGRFVMRLLALANEMPAVFSLGGSFEVILYGAIVGLAGGIPAAILARALRRSPLPGGLLLGLAVYSATVATLPAHIADTARPFVPIMPLVWSLFGLCFLLWGIAVAKVAVRG